MAKTQPRPDIIDKLVSRYKKRVERIAKEHADKNAGDYSNSLERSKMESVNDR